MATPHTQRSRPPLTQQPWFTWGLTAVVVIALAVAPLIFDPTTNGVLARIGVYAVAVLGLNVVMGYTGQVSLGQIFFLGLGAYVTAYGATHNWPIVLTFIAAIVIPGLVGLIIALPAARLGGLAIAMVTVALPLVGVPLAKRLSEWTGGSQGLDSRFSDTPDEIGESVLQNDQWQLYLVILVAAITFLLTRNLVRGKYGRAFAVVKANEAVAGSMGVSPYWYKVLAFAIASMIGGVSGFLYMAVIQFTSPETLSFGHSIQLLAAMVIGGAGSILGSLLGGAYYILAPMLTNIIDPNLTALLQGAILLLVLFLLPGGLVSLPRAVRREWQRLRRRAGRPPRDISDIPPESSVAAATLDPTKQHTESTEKRQGS